MLDSPMEVVVIRFGLDYEGNGSSLVLVNIVLVCPSGFSLNVFKTRLIRRSFHILVRNTLFPSTTDVGSHYPPPWGPASR